MEKFIRKIRLRNSDFDRNDNLLPSAVLELFQDLAGEHAEYLHIGYEDMLKQDLVWMIVRQKIEIIKNPKAYQTVTLVTWPEEPRKIDMKRDYLMLDENGEVICKGVSLWVIVSNTTRRIVRVKDITFGDNIFIEEKTFDDIEKLDHYEVSSFKTINTYYSDLDHNGHVNNCKYMNFIESAITELHKKRIVYFQIDYIKELPLNGSVDIGYIKEDDSTYKICGVSEGNISFVSLIKAI